MTPEQLQSYKIILSKLPPQYSGTIGDLLNEITDLREAVRVLAKDKVHGVADIIGREVCENRIAYDEIQKQRAKK